MFDRGIRAVRKAAVVLVALQSVAAYGYAQAHDIDEYVEELVVYGDPTMVRGAEISQQTRAEVEATIADLNADADARLHERIRLSTREALAAAAPTDDAETKSLQATVRNRQTDYPRAEEGPDTSI